MADDPKPPYVRFEYRAIEDRNQTIETGHYCAKDVAYAIITPPGSRDTTEKVATEWLEGLGAAVNEGRFPAAWLDAYRAGYKRWLETQEDPEFGTPIKNWPALSPAQLKTVQGANIRSVEELAEANEEAIARIGMGGRALKEKARAWVETSHDKGKVAEEVDALRKQNEELKTQLDAQAKSIKELNKIVDALKKEPV